MGRLEEVDDLVEAELEGVLLHTAFDGLLCQLALLVLQVHDLLFDGVGDGEAVDCHVDGLGETVDAVDCLLLDELVDR